MAITPDFLLRETIVNRIHDSRDKLVAVATIPVDAAFLAAQQVQNIRLSDVETPKDVGWGELGFEFLLAFVINSSFVEKLSAKLFSKVFGRLIGHQQVLDELETEFEEKFLNDLIAAEDRLARFGNPAISNAMRQAAKSSGTGLAKMIPGEVPSVATLQAMEPVVKDLVAVEARFSAELKRVARISGVKATELVPYANGVSNVLSRLDKKDAASFVKAAKEVAKKGPIAKSATLATQDTAGVGMVEHFMAAATAQRLHICANHNRFEFLVRTLPLKDETYVHLAKSFDRSLLENVGSEIIDLDSMRSELKLRFEALIWSIHLGFSKRKGIPDIITDRTTQFDCMIGVKERITKYLFDRFGTLVEEFTNAHGSKLDWDRQNTGPRALYLRRYFWALADQIAD